MLWVWNCSKAFTDEKGLISFEISCISIRNNCNGFHQNQSCDDDRYRGCCMSRGLGRCHWNVCLDLSPIEMMHCFLGTVAICQILLHVESCLISLQIEQDNHSVWNKVSDVIYRCMIVVKTFLGFSIITMCTK